MSEQAVAPVAQTPALPDGLDDVIAAAIANRGMSSGLPTLNALDSKLASLCWFVLVNGATGTGRVAAQIAKHLGAKKIIANGGNAEVLQSLAPCLILYTRLDPPPALCGCHNI
jgi:NADPH:quinone reductase-like Zn-dependent oxidoreductase